MKTKHILIAAAIIVAIAFVVSVIRKRKQSNISIIGVSEQEIPAKVLAEPVEDWMGDILTYNGKRYTPVDGVWTQL